MCFPKEHEICKNWFLFLMPPVTRCLGDGLKKASCSNESLRKDTLKEFANKSVLCKYINDTFF